MSNGIGVEALYRVTAPHFCAGVIAMDGRVIEAAPILRWTIGKPVRWLAMWVKNKGYKIELLRKSA